MFTIKEDLYLEEFIFPCPRCGEDNYRYSLTEAFIDRCTDCQEDIIPKPSGLLDSRAHRESYHRNGLNNAEEKEGPKVHSCSYSPY
jgi:hypothetical protein